MFMRADDLFEYLFVTDQLDEHFGIKEIMKCPKCNSELYIYEDNVLYCPLCDSLNRYNTNKKIYNKKLTPELKKIIDDESNKI